MDSIVSLEYKKDYLRVKDLKAGMFFSFPSVRKKRRIYFVCGIKNETILYRGLDIYTLKEVEIYEMGTKSKQFVYLIKEEDL